MGDTTTQLAEYRAANQSYAQLGLALRSLPVPAGETSVIDANINAADVCSLATAAVVRYMRSGRGFATAKREMATCVHQMKRATALLRGNVGR